MSCYPVAAVILAAGSSSRMGKPKQLLPFGSGTLLTHAIDVAGEAGFAPVIVVVGANSRQVRSVIASKRVEIADNPQWETGMGSSIRAGVERVLRDCKEAAAIALMVGDQPRVTAEHLSTLRRLLLESESDAAAAAYGESLGVPALFRRKLFPQLMGLKPEQGAKSLLIASDIKLVSMPLPEAEIDIDTPADCKNMSVSGTT